MESLDNFLLFSSFLVGGSRKRLRFSGTDAAARPLGIVLDTELEPGYGGTKKIKKNSQCNYTFFYRHFVFLFFHTVLVNVTSDLVPVILFFFLLMTLL